MSFILPKKKSWSKERWSRKLKQQLQRDKKLDLLQSIPGATLGAHNKIVVVSNAHREVKVDRRKHIAIGVVASILENAQSSILRTYLAGQIARAACIYKVDEIIVLDDGGKEPGEEWSRACEQFLTILEYLDCPQYLRRALFSNTPALEQAGVLNPLDAPHHFRKTETKTPFREGIVTETRTDSGCFVNVGLVDEVHVSEVHEPGTRVTVQLTRKLTKGPPRLVPRDYPKRKKGLYWGYTVRAVRSLADMMAEEFDLTIGTSDKGSQLTELDLPTDFTRCLIAFGGLHGLEAVSGGSAVQSLFNYYVNTCPNQGSRTIRAEEAIFISLAHLSSCLGF